MIRGFFSCHLDVVIHSADDLATVLTHCFVTVSNLGKSILFTLCQILFDFVVTVISVREKCLVIVSYSHSIVCELCLQAFGCTHVVSSCHRCLAP